MNDIGICTTFLVAIVFAYSAALKLRSIKSTAMGFRSLRLPASNQLAVVVPIVELITAVALLLAPPVGAGLAIALLAAFSMVLAANLHRESAHCGCFGERSETPPGWADLIRNLVLFGLCVPGFWVTSAGMPSIEALIVGTTSALVGALVIALARLKADIHVLWRTELG